MKTIGFNFKGVAALMVAAMTTGFASCEKNDPTDDIELPEIDPVVASVSAKWINKDAGSEYASFELQTDGTYIVSEYIAGRSLRRPSVLRVSSLQGVKLPPGPFHCVTNGNELSLRAETRHLVTHVGKYTISGNVITLIDYGLIEAFRVSNDEFSFVFRPDGSVESIEFVGLRAPAVNESKRTVLMCRMWDIERIRLEGGDDGSLSSWLGAGWEDAMSELLEGFIRFEVDGRQVSLCAMMSKSGTYLSIFRDDRGNYFTEIQSEDLFFGGVSSVVGVWEWADSKETRVNWSQTGSFGMDGGSGVFEIRELTLEKFVITGSADGLMNYTEEFKAANKF